jgi:BON domain-containing protein
MKRDSEIRQAVIRELRWDARVDETGVRDLATPSTVASGIVRREIEEALERRADRSAKLIGVSIDDGNAIMTGTVRSWPEKRAVLVTARFTTVGSDVVTPLHIVPEW